MLYRLISLLQIPRRSRQVLHRINPVLFHHVSPVLCLVASLLHNLQFSRLRSHQSSLARSHPEDLPLSRARNLVFSLVDALAASPVVILLHSRHPNRRCSLHFNRRTSRPHLPACSRQADRALSHRVLQAGNLLLSRLLNPVLYRLISLLQIPLPSRRVLHRNNPVLFHHVSLVLCLVASLLHNL